MKEIENIKYLIDVKKLNYSQISQITGLDRRTIKKWYLSKEFPQYQRNKITTPVKDKIIGYVKEWLEEDKILIRKGKIKKIRTASKMHEDLVEIDMRCSERTVRKYLSGMKPKEVFIEQEYTPADDMQVDWGEMYLDFQNDKRIKVYLFIATLPYSNTRFVCSYTHMILILK